jgi:hypothetical protein
MSKRSEYHQARNKQPIQHVWDYLMENGPATMAEIREHLLNKKAYSGRHRRGIWNGMTSQSITGIVTKNPYYFYQGTDEEKVKVTYYSDVSTSSCAMTVWHARPINDIVRRIVCSGRPLAKFPSFFREQVYKAYPDCPKNWQARGDHPFWETVKEIRKEVLLSKS